MDRTAMVHVATLKPRVGTASPSAARVVGGSAGADSLGPLFPLVLPTVNIEKHFASQEIFNIPRPATMLNNDLLDFTSDHERRLFAFVVNSYLINCSCDK